MKQRWAAQLFVLALCAVATRPLSAQSQQATSRDPNTGSELRQNYPNPFNPETRISFSIGGYPGCTDPGRQYRVTLKVFNVFAQLVAVPVLQGGVAGVAGGQPLENVFLTCGEYTAYWDGKVLGTGREAASGIYAYRLEIDTRAVTRKMTIRK
jgi:hypothetical protein